MRTTLTLDDDVVATLHRVQEARRVGFTEVVNEVLRLGLQQLDAPRQKSAYRTPSVSLGGCLLGSVDDVSAVLSFAEGDAYR